MAIVNMSKVKQQIATEKHKGVKLNSLITTYDFIKKKRKGKNNKVESTGKNN